MSTMKLLPILVPLSLLVGLSAPASAAKKKSHHPSQGTAPAAADAEEPGEEKPAAEKANGEADAQKPPLDFDFFAGQPGGTGGAGASADSDALTLDIEGKERTRRWMLKVHQTLGITTWLAMVATVTVGQLNYNKLWGGGGGSDANKWQTPHRALVISTSALFAAAATFAILAPTPHKKPLRFDTGLVHRIAVIGATVGMLTEGVLGWITTHQADAGNPHNAKAMAQAHQIIGYTTLGFLTIAGTVWIF
jgi:hypothetical protein